MTRIACYFIFSSLAATTFLRADTVWISSGGGNPIPYADVKIVAVKGDQILFRTSAGKETSRELKQVTRMMLDDEPAFNAAEEAYAAAKWDQATDGYQKTIKSTAKDWLKEWCSLRLMESANKSGRFDAAITGYIAMVMKDPRLAAQYKPVLPGEQSTFLDTAVSEVNSALGKPNLSLDQKQTLLSFLLEIHRIRKDRKAAGEVAEQLLKLNADNANDPGAAQALAELKLGLARLAIDEKNFQKAIDEVQANKALFTDPQQQADALYCVAEARFGLAEKANDPTAWKDAALAYMRVVAHFKDLPDNPHVPDALLKTAAIHEKLNDPQTALLLYQQVATQYNNTPAGPKAKENADRLKAQTEEKG